MFGNNILFCLIGIIITLCVIWLIGLGITLNPTWVFDTMIGRCIAIFLTIITISANLREL